MANYVPTTWVDELLAGGERYDILTNAGVEIYPNTQIVLTTGVTVPGTSVSAAALNNIEAAVEALMNGGWIAGGTWTYVAADRFKIPTDLTDIFTAGRLLKWTQTTPKYGVVVSSSYSAPDTTVVIAVNTSYVVTNAAISLAFYSFSLPLGWPTALNQTVDIHAATDKAIPVDADEVGLWDSVTGLLNRLSWANLKATLINTALTWVAAQIFQSTIAQAVTSAGAGATYNQSGTGDIAAFQDAGVLTVRVLDQGGIALVPQAGGFQSVDGMLGYDSAIKRLVLKHPSHNYPVPIDPRNGFRQVRFQITYA